jgi:type IV pilus assembly protein PilW
MVSKRPLEIRKGQPGFTIVELLIAVAIAGTVMGGVYSVYVSQQGAYEAQQQVAAMEQKVRAAMYFLNRDIAMAGCDPAGNANARILAADANSIRLTEDLNGNGDASEYNEDITYSLYTSDGVQKLGRRTPYNDKNSKPVKNQPVAENVERLNFVYLDRNGQVLPTPVADPSLIRSVQITLVVRADTVDSRYINQHIYSNQQGQTLLGPKNDHFRRRLTTTEVWCRNLTF